MTKALRLASLTVIVSAATSFTLVGAQTNGTPEVFKALGVNTTRRSGFGKPFDLSIYVNRWATPGEFASFLSTLKEAGTQGVLKMLLGREQVGFLRTPQPLGFPLTLAVQSRRPDGGRHVVIISPRKIFETNFSAQTLDYPFMVIDMTVPAEHAGTGTILQLAKFSIAKDGDQFTVENFEGSKTMLKSVIATPQAAEPK